MTSRLTILTLILLIASNGFGQTFEKAERYRTKQFDVAIFPANYLDLIPGQRFTPTKQDVDNAERILRNKLKSLNVQLVNQSPSPIIHKKLRKYKRQYFGYVDKNGDRILLINCFWAKSKHDSNRWLLERIDVLDGGSYYWNVKVNLEREELFDLGVNGHA